jgi:hypothetical protein
LLQPLTGAALGEVAVFLLGARAGDALDLGERTAGFSAISRSCSIRKPCAGLSPSMPPISPRGTLRFERWVPSS